MSSRSAYKRPQSQVTYKYGSNMDSKYQILKSGLKNTKQNQQFSDNDNFMKTKQFLQSNLKGKHNPELCLCEQCNCGNHLCKLTCPRPHIHNSTTYNNSYKPVTARYEKIPDFEPNKTKNGFIDLGTTYRDKFTPQSTILQSPVKQKDLMKFDGPFQTLTTYTQKYPGWQPGPNITYKNQDEFRGGLKFFGNTTYNQSFPNRSSSLSKPIKQQDNLKTGSQWFGSTSYRDSYNRNPQMSETISFKPQGRYDKPIIGKDHFDTNYRNSYVNKQLPNRCPAQTILKSILSKSMIRK